MDYTQFKNLLQLKGLDNKESIAMLEELIDKFPYFQSARLLLAKSMHEQQNINYNDSLKLAAAYATDRKTLHDLVNPRTTKTENGSELAASFQASEITHEVHNGNPLISSLEGKESEPFLEYYSEDEISGRAFEEQREKERIIDPHEVIRQRLSEILVAKKEKHKEQVEEKIVEQALTPLTDYKLTSIENIPDEQPSQPPTFPPASQEEENKAEVKPNTEQIIIQEAEKAHDVLDRMEIEHAMEESILASLEKLPVIAPEKTIPSIPQFKEKIIPKAETPVVTVSKVTVKEPKSFTQWLKSISTGPFHNYEEVHMAEKAVADTTVVEVPELSSRAFTHESDVDVHEDELIDRFIATEPKIVPSKAEFYSPANQAKKSITEHEDVVSETLARIYHNQGNLAKAKWCYEKLSLLHPEKRAHYSALMHEIEQQEQANKS